MIDVNTIDKYLLMHGDCMDKLKEIPDGSIDLILCDPPYNLAKYSTGNMKFDWRSEINNDVAQWDLKELAPVDFIDEFKRVLSPTGNIFIFTSYNLIGKWHEVFDSEFDTFQFMVWHKTNPVPNIRKSSFLNSCELIVCMWNKGHLMKCLGAQIKSYQADEYIFLSGDEINFIGIVLNGTVEIMKENLSGNKHILAFMGTADMFAEGIVCTLKRISPVTVRAKEDVQILFIPYERVIKSCGNSCTFHISLIQNMMVILGERNVRLNRKLELLTLKGMREKLASYLLSEASERNSGMFQIKLNRSELADYLNVSRTSMCRELARMKEEGMIDYYGNSFKLTDKRMLEECLEV